MKLAIAALLLFSTVALGQATQPTIDPAAMSAAYKKLQQRSAEHNADAAQAEIAKLKGQLTQLQAENQSLRDTIAQLQAQAKRAVEMPPVPKPATSQPTIDEFRPLAQRFAQTLLDAKRAADWHEPDYRYAAFADLSMDAVDIVTTSSLVYPIQYSAKFSIASFKSEQEGWRVLRTKTEYSYKFVYTSDGWRAINGTKKLSVWDLKQYDEDLGKPDDFGREMTIDDIILKAEFARAMKNN